MTQKHQLIFICTVTATTPKFQVRLCAYGAAILELRLVLMQPGLTPDLTSKILAIKLIICLMSKEMSPTEECTPESEK